ncbi:hypothetical protein NL676_019649 [Syzygium grande]|nr:hypothetical protein NL676_019649 [Syzygium grande]
MLGTGNYVLYNSKKDVIWQSSIHRRIALWQASIYPQVKRCSRAVPPLINQKASCTSTWKRLKSCAISDISTVLNTTGHNIRSITRGGPQKEGMIWIMRTNADGILWFYLYNITKKGNQSTVWSSTDDKCSPRGISGFNGFGANKDRNDNRLCLTGCHA